MTYAHIPHHRAFLSSNAQDFIEDPAPSRPWTSGTSSFLSSNAQDFIEDHRHMPTLQPPTHS